MPKYFKNIKSEQQAKERYRVLAQKHHPDKGGSDANFQELKKEYEDILIYFKVHKELAIPEIKKVRKKPDLKKEYADRIADQAADIAGTTIRAGFDFIFDKFFTLK